MIIVRLGGGEKINLDYVCQDFALLVKKEKAILIHGANFKRNEIAQKLGNPTKTVTMASGLPSVYTDERGIEIFLMTYPGLMNKKIVAKLQALKVNAVGLCGIDGKIWEGERKDKILIIENGKQKILSGNFGGKVKKINSKLINLLLKEGFIPVISSPALSNEGEIINVDNDLATAKMVEEMKIKKIIFLLDQPGLLKDPKDSLSIISKIKKEEIEKYFEFAQGRMKKKILAIKMMIEAGAEKIYIGDGRIKNPIQKVLKGRGTIIY